MGAVVAVGVTSMLWAMPERQTEGPQATALVPPAKPSNTPRERPDEPSPSPTKSASPPVLGPRPPSWKPPAAKAPVREDMTEVELTRPDRGDLIDEDRDFTVEGTVHNLGDADLRIFIFPEKRRKFFLADYGPEDIDEDGRWSIESTGIGYEFGEDGDAHRVQVVRADDKCRKRLSGLDLGDDNYPEFSALPHGCRVLAEVRVIEGEE